MVGRRVLAPITMLIAILALLGAPEAEARKHRHHQAASRTRRCHSDKQCRGSVCNDAGRCCAFGDFACGANCCDPAVTSACCGDRACVDLYSDNNNCGSCGIACSGGKACQLGDCVCPSGETDCGGVCKDLSSDAANCGACGNACGAGFRCVESECRCEDSGDSPCNGTCVDTATDRNNCGLCGRTCPADQECLSGACRSSCGPCEERVDNFCILKEPGKDTVCNGVCVDIATDLNNCGGCGTVCPSGDRCTIGICEHCPAQYSLCPVEGYGDLHGFCCRPETPVCCYTELGGSCCGTDTTCCDGYCCPAGTQCCPNPLRTYPCVPDGQQCPA